MAAPPDEAVANAEPDDGMQQQEIDLELEVTPLPGDDIDVFAAPNGECT